MKETETLRWFDYLQALGRDKWIDWTMSALMFLLIVSWFLPRSAADFLINVIAMVLLVAVAIRGGYVVAYLHLGHRFRRESPQSVRFRDAIGKGVFILYVVVAILLTFWRYIR